MKTLITKVSKIYKQQSKLVLTQTHHNTDVQAVRIQSHRPPAEAATVRKLSTSSRP